MVKALVASNADVNQARTTDGIAPVFIAAYNGHVDVVTVLLGSKADPNRGRKVKNGFNMVIGKESPLQIAKKEGHPAVVDLLLRHGAAK